MGTESFCLKWHDFETNISQGFRDIYNAKDFLDVSLVCEGSSLLQAHKVVLSACSSVFYEILQNHPHQHPLLYMKGVRFSDLQSILTFMYNGEVSLPQDDLNSFLDVAEDLKIRGLTSSATGGTSPNRNKTSTPDPRSVSSQLPAKLRPASTDKSIAPPAKRSRRGGGSRRVEEDQQETEDAKSIKSEPDSKHAKSDDGSIVIDVDTVLGGMLEADVSIREENEENLENFSGGGNSEQHQSFSGIFNSLPLDNKGMSIEELAAVYLKKAETGTGYMCQVCGKRVRDRYAAQDHLECQHYPSHERYTCEICGKKLHARKLYLGHKNYCQKYSTQSHSFSV
jgi:hypothetical protein